jgi:hypothetical protein
MEKAIKDFFATINTEDVNKQLQGILQSTELLTPSTIKYELEERAIVAKLFFECHQPGSGQSTPTARFGLSRRTEAGGERLGSPHHPFR